MVAEWMIFANVAVAKKIHQHFPFSSLLRNHPEPRERDFDALSRCVETLGMTIDLSTNKTLANSLVEVINCVSPETANIILMMATYAMSEARYFSSGTTPVSHFYHYGLACDYYTHFTSPIRRYVDVLVHRMLWAALQGHAEVMSDAQLTVVADHLNERNRAAKQVERDSTTLFQAFYFRYLMTRPSFHPTDLQETAVIYRICTNGLLVLIPKFGIRGSIYLRDANGVLSVPSACLENEDSIVDYNPDVNSQTLYLMTSTKRTIPVELFDNVIVAISLEESRYHPPSLRLSLQRFGMPEKRPGGARPAAHSQQKKRGEDVTRAVLEAQSQTLTKEDLVFGLDGAPANSPYLQSTDSVYYMFECFKKFAITDDETCLPPLPGKKTARSKPPLRKKNMAS